MSEFDSTADPVIVWIERAKAAEARLTEAEAALRDFADHGLRCDLNPTMASLSMPGTEVYDFFSRYLRSADENVRARARRAVLAGEREATPCEHDWVTGGGVPEGEILCERCGALAPDPDEDSAATNERETP